MDEETGYSRLDGQTETETRASRVKPLPMAATLLTALLLGVCVGYVAFSPAGAWPGSVFRAVSSDDYPLNFLVVGDWGRDGNYNQTFVAEQMGRVGEELNVDFIVSTGDNFYDYGLEGEDDPRFETSYSNIYTAPSLHKTWYTVLGNHDYRGNAPAQLSETLKRRDGRWWCQREFELLFPLCGKSVLTGTCDSSIEFFFIDTTPFVNEYWSVDAHHIHNWEGLVLPREEQLRLQAVRLESNLRSSTARWKLVIGHHTIRSTGVHGDVTDVAEVVNPLLKAHGVDLYINGHDHNLQHIKGQDSKLRYITSGAGSKAWKNARTPYTENGTQFFYHGQGFVSVSVAPSTLRVVFHDAFGSALHSLDLKKEQ